jgi:hypothetical protein
VTPGWWPGTPVPGIFRLAGQGVLSTKVTLDLDKLLEEGSIDPAEYEKLTQLAAGGTSALAFNILIGFGVIAVSAGSLALLPTAITAIVLGWIIGTFRVRKLLIFRFAVATCIDFWRFENQ